MRVAFRSKGARSAVCNASAYAVPIAIKQFAAACKLDGRAFAQAYADYFNETYAQLMWNTASGPDRSSNIEDHEYLTQSLSELPIKKVDAPLVLSKLPGCAYYQGVFSFSVNQIQAARTLSGNLIYLSGHRTDRLSGDDNFIIVDKAAMKGGIKDWCEAEYFTPPRCRGNVIVTRGCRDKPENTILRVFSIDKPGSKTFNQQEASR